MSNSIKNNSYSLELGVFLLALLPFLLISFFNQPTDDDFLFAKSLQGMGVRAVPYMYKMWTGRYTSVLLYCTVFYTSKLSTLLWLIKLAPILFIVANVLSCYFMLTGLFSKAGRKQLSLITLYITAIYLYGVPSVAFAFYWYTGAAVYTSGQILLFLIIGATPRCFSTEKKIVQYGWATLIASCLILLVGCNEVFIPVAVLYSVYLLFVLKNNKKIAFVWLAVALLFSAVAFLAPGNFVRASQVGNMGFSASKIIGTLLKTGLLSTSHLVKWLASPVLWLLSFCILLVLNKLYDSKSSKVYTNAYFLVIFTAYFFVTGLTVAMSIWVSNDVPTRIWNAEYLFFLIFWFFCLFKISEASEAIKKFTLVYWDKRYVISCLALVVIFISISSSVHKAYIDLIFKANKYARASDARYKELISARDKKMTKVLLSPLAENEYNYPETIYIHDIETNPKDIANLGYASLFGVDSVCVKYKADPTRTYFKE